MMRLKGLILAMFVTTIAVAQENSPYSRYGLGDLTPNQNITTRGMGGISAGYSNFQNINLNNPASYGNFNWNTIYDIGVEIDSRTLKADNPTSKFTATNLLVSYLQLGFPIRMKKANKKGIFLGVSLGLKPISRINYKIFKTERLPGIDSLFTIYEGSGGLNEANIGAGLKFKQFNIGFNTGYRFGNKNYSTNLSFANDTVSYYQSTSSSKTSFGSVFLNTGMQYEYVFKNNMQKEKGKLRVGVYGSLKQNMSANQSLVRETVSYDISGALTKIDSVFQSNQPGTVVYPATFGAGFTYQDSIGHWFFGADYEKTYWNGYSFYGQKDPLKNNWKIRAGVEYLPASLNTPVKKYFSFVRYRAGFYYGPDRLDIGSKLPEYGITFGAGFPLKLRRNYYETQSSYLNTAIEIGSRGNKNNNLRESIVRISFGLSLSDLWFNRSKYY